MSQAVSPESSPESRLESPIQVLVVEDHSVVREGIVAVLNRQKDIAVVAEAKNGKEAINLHAAHRPDITLMDLRMPQMEGLEAILKIRAADPQSPNHYSHHLRHRRRHLPVPASWRTRLPTQRRHLRRTHPGCLPGASGQTNYPRRCCP